MTLHGTFTTVVGVDAKCIEQLKVTVPTWRRHRSMLWRQPMLAFFDHRQISQSDVRDVLKHDDLACVVWPPAGLKYESQRERMLSGFVHVPGRHVTTTWWLKLDCDVIAFASNDWYDPSWLETDNVFIGPSWGYTKPADQMDRLDDWARFVPALCTKPALYLPREPGSNVLRHKRMCSWVMFCQTNWTAEVGAYCDYGMLPVPSQDGYHWYCAARRGDPWLPVNMKRRGWTNKARMRSLVATAEEAMNERVLA